MDKTTLERIVNDPGFFGPLRDISREHNCSPESLLTMLNKVFNNSIFRRDLMRAITNEKAQERL